jgi:ribosomal protein L11 methyltransferase
MKREARKMIVIRVDTKDEAIREILIAQLSEAGFESFEESETLNAYISEDKFSKAELDDLIQLFHLTYTSEILPQKNWNEEWEKNFQPVQVDDFCSVRASFHPQNNNVRFDIVITPKMSFGTGHHSTTFLMMQFMQGVSFEEKTVFDFGTGTGILAILAEKMGAKTVLAIDIDEWSIINAKENAEMNGCEQIDLVQTGNIQTCDSFDIMLANINRNVILENLPVMVPLLKANGVLLLSGLLQDDFMSIDEIAANLGLNLIEKRDKNGWIAIKYSNPKRAA